MVYMGVHILRYLKKELTWATDKTASGYQQFKSYSTKELNSKAILGLNDIACIAMLPLVTYSDCFEI